MQNVIIDITLVLDVATNFTDEDERARLFEIRTKAAHLLANFFDRLNQDVQKESNGNLHTKLFDEVLKMH